MATDSGVAHNQAAIMKYIVNQSKPITANNYLHSISTGDYVRNLLENKVSQVEMKHGSATTGLYSSIKGLENLVSFKPIVSYTSGTTAPIFSTQMNPTSAPKYSTQVPSTSYTSIPFYYKKESPKYRSVGFYG